MTALKQIKSILFIILIIAVVVLSGAVYLNTMHQEKEVRSDITFEKIFSLSELSVIQYNYKDVLSYKEPRQFNGVNIPLTEKSFLIVYTGYIKASVDFATAKLDTDDKNTLIVTLDHAEITDNVINQEDASVYDEESGLFNKLSIQNVFDILSSQKKKIKKDLIESGFLQQADDHAIKLLQKWLGDLGYEHVEIRFRDEES